MASPEPTKVDDGGSRLLSLSAELRNLIYGEVLVKNERISPDKDHCQQPSLLLVNRQIRQEARPIYYTQNNFRIDCPDFDATALIAFRMQSKDVVASMCGRDEKLPVVSLKSSTGEEPRNWANLFMWAKAVHEDNRLFCKSHKRGAARQVAASMMKIATQLQDLPWTRVRYILRDAACTRDDVVWTGRRSKGGKAA